jgi:hypothetical protein
VAWRDIDQQIADLAACDCFQVIDDDVDVPAGHERRRRLDDRPGKTHELAQAPRRALELEFRAKGWPREPGADADVWFTVRNSPMLWRQPPIHPVSRRGSGGGVGRGRTLITAMPDTQR